MGLLLQRSEAFSNRIWLAGRSVIEPKKSMIVTERRKQQQQRQGFSTRELCISSLKNNNDNEMIMGDNDKCKQKINIIDWKNKSQVLFYRSSLIIASLAYAGIQIMQSSFLENSGLSRTSVENFGHMSGSLFTWTIIATALSSPPNLEVDLLCNDNDKNGDSKKDNATRNSLFLLLNESLPKLALFTLLLNIGDTFIFHQATTISTSTTMSNLFISAICVREVIFFGAAYKAEAIFAILAIIISASIGIHGSNPQFSVIAQSPSSPLSLGLALCLLVLSFGKIFEPLSDDLIPNDSAFFRDDDKFNTLDKK